MPLNVSPAGARPGECPTERAGICAGHRRDSCHWSLYRERERERERERGSGATQLGGRHWPGSLVAIPSVRGDCQAVSGSGDTWFRNASLIAGYDSSEEQLWEQESVLMAVSVPSAVQAGE